VIKGGSGRRKYLALTDCGRALAEGLHRRRRTITAYLTFLGLSEAASATEAHLWEHRVSHEIVTAMEVVLQRGKTFAGPPQTASRTQPESRQLRQRFKNPHRYKAQRRRGNRLQ
jgi:Mn-dependent DtxR family transcriptional regulator